MSNLFRGARWQAPFGNAAGRLSRRRPKTKTADGDAVGRLARCSAKMARLAASGLTDATVTAGEDRPGVQSAVMLCRKIKGTVLDGILRRRDRAGLADGGEVESTLGRPRSEATADSDGRVEMTAAATVESSGQSSRARGDRVWNRLYSLAKQRSGEIGAGIVRTAKKEKLLESTVADASDNFYQVRQHMVRARSRTEATPSPPVACVGSWKKTSRAGKMAYSPVLSAYVLFQLVLFMQALVKLESHLSSSLLWCWKMVSWILRQDEEMRHTCAVQMMTLFKLRSEKTTGPGVDQPGAMNMLASRLKQQESMLIWTVLDFQQGLGQSAQQVIGQTGRYYTEMIDLMVQIKLCGKPGAGTAALDAAMEAYTVAGVGRRRLSGGVDDSRPETDSEVDVEPVEDAAVEMASVAQDGFVIPTIQVDDGERLDIILDRRTTDEQADGRTGRRIWIDKRRWARVWHSVSRRVAGWRDRARVLMVPSEEEVVGERMKGPSLLVIPEICTPERLSMSSIINSFSGLDGGRL